MAKHDALVIGAGFGGLAAALRLAEAGARVVLCEALRYPGGCASTFERHGYHFESGATLFSGFAEGQLFKSWLDRYQWPIHFEALDPMIRFRLPGLEVPISPHRQALVDHFKQLAPEHSAGLEGFFKLQERTANLLWPIFDNPERLPPFSLQGLTWHLKRAWRYPQLLLLVGRSLISVLKRYGLHRCAPFVSYCNALCQITIQTSVYEAEAPFALSSLDYPFRGTGHIRGGIGELAEAMVATLRDLGVEVRMANRVRALEASPEGWLVSTRGEVLEASQVVANLTPHALQKLLPSPHRGLDKRARRIEDGWGAAMLYLSLDDHPTLPREAFHLQCINDPQQALIEGNHIFCSVSGAHEQRAPNNQRTATVSTHIPMKTLRNLAPSARGGYIQGVQDAMRESLKARAPDIASAVDRSLPASPRTFERFTGRTHGYVGGPPRRTGLGNYRGLFPSPVQANLWMVGDSVFPGQSTLATAVGGTRTANAVLRRLSLKTNPKTQARRALKRDQVLV